MSRKGTGAEDGKGASAPHVVILGGGFGGARAARTLRTLPVRVTLIDRTNHHVFQPLLYQVATAGLAPSDIASPIRWMLRRHQNVTVLLGEVSAVDPHARLVVVEGQPPLKYDSLIAATGARHW